MQQNLATCVDPDAEDWKPVLAKLNRDLNGLQRSLSSMSDGWENNPFGSEFFGETMNLGHKIMGLVKDDVKYPPEHSVPQGYQPGLGPESRLDSECFTFRGYDDHQSPDPAGCRIFSKSFIPLRDARSCIMTILHRDPKWEQRFSLQMPLEGESTDYEHWCSNYETTTSIGRNSLLKHIAPNAMAKMKMCNKWMDTKRRAQEMLKNVLYKSLDRMKTMEDFRKKVL